MELDDRPRECNVYGLRVRVCAVKRDSKLVRACLNNLRHYDRNIITYRCALFTNEDFKHFEYREDLKNWWNKGICVAAACYISHCYRSLRIHVVI